MLLLTLRLGSLFTMPSQRSLSMTIWSRWQSPWKDLPRIPDTQASSLCGTPQEILQSSNSNQCFVDVFSEGPPRKTCGKCGCSHNHGECPAHSTTFSKCGSMNHWAQQCRSSGRRNSSTGHSPSPGRPQNRQRWFSSNKPNKGRGCGGGSGKQKSTPKRPGSGRGRGGGKHFKMNALTVTGLPGPQHPPKVDGLGGNKTKESVSMNAGLPRPAHPPKVSGEPFINTFTCDSLTSNGNGLYEPPSNQGKAYTDTDSDGKTEIITDITCKFKGKLVAMEVKVDPGSETNCIPLSYFRHLFPQLCSKDGNPKENAPEPTLAQFETYDGGIMTSHGWIILPTRDIRDSNKFHLWDTMWWPGRRPGSWSVMQQQLGWDSWRSYVQTRHPGSKGK